jgi:hypothetical protein
MGGQPVMTQRDPAVPRALKVVSLPGGQYPDWESIYEDNVVWVYRTIFARVGSRVVGPTPKT